MGRATPAVLALQLGELRGELGALGRRLAVISQLYMHIEHVLHDVGRKR